ncbi:MULTISPECIES: MarR family winged helix-turn-helix transcriptional regulator [unclassified Sporolactobacillus]|uniref:MarR family winged helix-turn-helix transcriptional regulator n=1 Tax=unclassified Sporolactobacillus TaxID=2628533 RepID=UPI002368CCEB|nr:MarR family transcriptional regulator [Sporolactobacillus sp. CQH2019]MDD9150666.1 MarR family transcriptional regulator [Sporolactobacillus sp. CQH2019]
MNSTREEAVEQLIHLQMLLHRYQMRNFKNFGPFNNPLRGQGRILSILKLKPEISQKDLCYLLDMSKQSLAELLGKLESNGYIVRETSTKDRRISNVKLTKEGAEVADKMDDTVPEMQELFDCLNDQEVNNLSDYLRRITKTLEEQFADDGDDLHKRMMEHFMYKRLMEHARHHFGMGGFPGFHGGR